MTQIASLGLTVDTSDAERAIAVLERLTDAARNAAAALEALAKVQLEPTVCVTADLGGIEAYVKSAASPHQQR